MRGGEGDCCVVVVGAGAAGALTASHLVTSLSSRYRVALVDPAPTTGRGAAYSTTDERHLLNVPASGMSAFPRDPEQLLPLGAQPPRSAGPAPGLRPAPRLRRLPPQPAADRVGVPRQRSPRTPRGVRGRDRAAREGLRRTALLGAVDRGAGGCARHWREPGHRLGACGAPGNRLTRRRP